MRPKLVSTVWAKSTIRKLQHLLPGCWPSTHPVKVDVFLLCPFPAPCQAMVCVCFLFLPLQEQFSAWSDFDLVPPIDKVCQCLEIYLIITTGCATGIQWVEARDAAKCPPLHRTASTTQLHSLKNVNIPKVEEPWSKGLNGLRPHWSQNRAWRSLYQGTVSNYKLFLVKQQQDSEMGRY